MRLGFTGTQDGMTRPQWEKCRFALEAHARVQHIELHHGDCDGADKQAHFIAKSINAMNEENYDYRPKIRIVTHPPIDPKKRAFCTAPDESWEPKEYIERNHDIVDATEALLAAPRGPEKSYPRSGTWATIRYARKLGRPVMIVWPDGSLE